MPTTQGGTTPPCVLIPSSFERQNYRRSASRLAVSAYSMRARLSSRCARVYVSGAVPAGRRLRSLSCMRATERASAGVRAAGCTRSPDIWSRSARCSSRRVADVLRDVGPHDSVQIDFVNAPMRSGIDTMLPAPYVISRR